MHYSSQISIIGINLNVINKLINKLNKIRHIKYVDNFNNSSNIKDIDPYYLLYSNKIMDKQQEIFYLHKKFPILDIIKNDMVNTLSEYQDISRLEESRILEDVNILLSEFNDVILEHNKALKLPDKDKHNKEIEKLID
jgi:hypothetical protein